MLTIRVAGLCIVCLSVYVWGVGTGEGEQVDKHILDMVNRKQLPPNTLCIRCREKARARDGEIEKESERLCVCVFVCVS